MAKSNISKSIAFISNIFKTIYSIIYIIKTSTARTKVIKSAHENNYIVLGNSPTLFDDLNNFTITNPDKYDYIVVNNFGLSDLYQQIKPKYYVLVDDCFFNDDEPIEFLETRKNLFQNILKNTTWEIEIFIPYFYYKKSHLINDFSSNKNIKFIPINKSPFYGFEKIKYWLFKKNLAMPQVQNVLIPALFLGINMGYKKILMFGTSNDWSKYIRVNSKNEVGMICNHFYDKNIEHIDETTECKQWIIKPGVTYKLHELFFDLSKMFRGYHDINNYAIKNSTKIINLSSYSFIDAFDRK